MTPRRLLEGVRRALSALLLAAAVAPAPAAAAPDAAHERGRAIYNFRCYFCHGYSGDAKTLATSYLQPPPRDFTNSRLSRAQIADALRRGRPGTAMKSFSSVLREDEILLLAAFVQREFVQDRAINSAYHTAANGWPGHQRHAAAFPFARGEIAIDAPLESLSAEQRRGRELFLKTCITCHDRGRVLDEGPAWSARPLSYPRMGFVPGQPNTPPVDAVSSASVYAKHEVPPRIADLTPLQRKGERLFQDNCAFCHGGDGTGKNWIGQFMEPKARDLTQYDRRSMPPTLLAQRIREGLPGTSMPGWQHVLKPPEIQALVAYVSRALMQPDPAPPARP